MIGVSASHLYTNATPGVHRTHDEQLSPSYRKIATQHDGFIALTINSFRSAIAIWQRNVLVLPTPFQQRLL